MPPEQLRDARSADTRSDIYALGATLYHMLAGTPPFKGRTIHELFDQVRNRSFPPLAEAGVHAPRWVQALIDRMTAKDPADRFQAPEDLGAYIDSHLEDDTDILSDVR
jgi:eukaryotic-like serine/threonine-protein kinase